MASDDDEEMAAHLIDLLKYEAKAANIGLKSRKIVEEKFSLASQLQKTMELYAL